MRTTENRLSDDFFELKRTRIIEIEISRPLPEITPLVEKDGDLYQRVLALVRLHDAPLGLIDFDLRTGAISPKQLAEQAWLSLHKQINQHLQDDGLTSWQVLSSQGIQSQIKPRCREARQEILSNPPPVSIILATRDRAKSLASTLLSIQALDYPKIELILVDNAPSTNETQDCVDLFQHQYPKNNLIMNYVREDNPGLAIAHNRGLEYARGSIVAFTDDDVRVDRNWLTEIVYGFTACPNVGCVTGLVIPSELETPAQLLFEEFGGFTKGFEQQIYDLNTHRPISPLFPYAAGRFGTGANMAFRTDLLREAGGFDPALGIGTPALGADDMAAFYTTIRQGSQLVYQPTALVFHQHRRTVDGLRKQMFGYGVGLTAFFTKCLLDDPGCVADFFSRIPAGLKYAFDHNSEKNQRKSVHYPKELDLIERKGMLYGPFAYLRSAWRYRKIRSHYSNKVWNEAPISQQDY